MKKIYTFICALALTAIVMPAQAQTREDLVGDYTLKAKVEYEPVVATGSYIPDPNNVEGQMDVTISLSEADSKSVLIDGFMGRTYNINEKGEWIKGPLVGIYEEATKQLIIPMIPGEHLINPPKAGRPGKYELYRVTFEGEIVFNVTKNIMGSYTLTLANPVENVQWFYQNQWGTSFNDGKNWETTGKLNNATMMQKTSYNVAKDKVAGTYKMDYVNMNLLADDFGEEKTTTFTVKAGTTSDFVIKGLFGSTLELTATYAETHLVVDACLDEDNGICIADPADEKSNIILTFGPNGGLFFLDGCKFTEPGDEVDVLIDASYAYPSDADAIHAVTTGTAQKSGAYTLTGVKVGNDAQGLPAGLYIINGKKVVVR